MPCEKHGPRASVTTKTSAFGLGFCLLSPSGHVFHTAWETMIKSYNTARHLPSISEKDKYRTTLIIISLNFSDFPTMHAPAPFPLLNLRLSEHAVSPWDFLSCSLHIEYIINYLYRRIHDFCQSIVYLRWVVINHLFFFLCLWQQNWLKLNWVELNVHVIKSSSSCCADSNECRRWALTLLIYPVSWWRHQVETFSALLAICAGNSPVPSEFPAQRPVTRSFDVSLICARINRWVNNRKLVIWYVIAPIMTSL